MKITGRVLEQQDIRGSKDGSLLRVCLTDESTAGQERWVFVPQEFATSFQSSLYSHVAPEVFRRLQQEAQTKDLPKLTGKPEDDVEYAYGESARFNMLVSFTGELIDSWEDLHLDGQQVFLVSQEPEIHDSSSRSF